jgi:hypothetical protein
MKLVWITDPHFDSVPDHVNDSFGRHVKSLGADCAVITGDLGDGSNGLNDLVRFGAWFEKPVYYVLGNHDLYNSSYIEAFREASNLSQEFPNLVFLDAVGPIRLTADVALVGNSGFYDCRAGNADSKFWLQDFTENNDLKGRSTQNIMTQCRTLAEMMAKPAKRALLDAANEYKHVYFATHVPPFTEATWHEGKRSDSEALPWFCNLTFGQVLADIAYEYSDVTFTVLCGHTHSSGEYKHFDNLKVLTGAAEYCYPAVWKVLEIPEETASG